MVNISNLVRLCPEDKNSGTLIRIACHELESRYLADLNAVERGLAISGCRISGKRKYRNPGEIPKPSIELERLTSRVYQKIFGSGAIGAYLNIDNSRSHVSIFQSLLLNYGCFQQINGPESLLLNFFHKPVNNSD